MALNATTTQICEHLKFGKAEEGDRVIYSEPTIAGDMAVVWNDHGEDSQLNIELLFNATMANMDAIRAIFNNK